MFYHTMRNTQTAVVFLIMKSCEMRKDGMVRNSV